MIGKSTNSFGALFLALLLLAPAGFAVEPNAMSVTFPSSGATLTKGETYALTWAVSDQWKNHLRYIVLADSSGEELLSIDTTLNTFAGGSTSWKVPSWPPAGKYIIRFGTQPSATAVLAEVPVNIVDPAQPANRAPAISSFSPPSSLKVGETGTWKITASDPEGGSLSYSILWGDEGQLGKQVQRGTLSAGQTATFTHIYYSAGTFVPSFTVTDDKGASAQASASVNVQQPSDITPPSVSTSTTQSADANNGVVTISASASDASGISEIKIYTAQGYPQGHGPYALAKTCSSSNSCTYTSGYSAGTYTYYATAKDASSSRNEGRSKESTFTVTAPPPANRAPTISSLSGSQNLKVGETGTWKIVASDPEGGYLTYSVKWGDESLKGSASAPQVLSVGQTATFTHIYYSAGTFVPSFTVTDDKGASAASSISVAVGTAQDGPDTQIKSGVIDIGQALEAGEIKLRFKDFTQPSNYFPAPVFDILDANDAVVASQTIETKSYYKFNAASGTSYLVYVEEFGLGFSLNAKWAKVRIYKVNGNPDPVSTIRAGDETNPATDGGSSPDTLLKTGAVNVGQVMDVGSIKIRLGDIGMEKLESGSALVDVLDSNEVVIKRMSIPYGSFRVASYGGKTYAIYAVETAGGTTLNSKWARLKGYQVNGLPDLPGYSLELSGMPSGATKVASGNLVVGQALSAAGFKVVLEDISLFPRNQGFTNKPAVIRITDSNDVTIEQRVVPVQKGFVYSTPSGKYYIYISSTQVLAYDPGKSNANVAIYSLSGSPFNLAPTISGLSGPQFLKVGETGTWKITASDPEGGSLSYSILWGDEGQLGKQVQRGTLSAGQTATFTHIYYSAGTFVPSFTVTDDKGASAQSSISVNVGSQPPTPLTKKIKLYKGWNQISVPVNGQVDMAKLSAKCNTKPYAWELTETGYAKMYELTRGVGYWLKSSADCEYEVSANSASQYGLVKLFPGWNVVGALDRQVAVSDYLAGCSISQGPWYYSHELGKPKPEYVYSGTLEPGKAYWVYADAACSPGSDLPPAPPS